MHVFHYTKLLQILTSYYHPQRSWDKVIFSEACVKNSVHRGGCAWQGGMCGGHAWKGGGMHVRGCVWWGAYMAGGAWQGDVHGGGMHGRGACMSGGHAW